MRPARLSAECGRWTLCKGSRQQLGRCMRARPNLTLLPGQAGERVAGWRDLGRTKWRLAKGDQQLEFTFAAAERPHHVSGEALSELALCIYKARL